MPLRRPARKRPAPRRVRPTNVDPVRLALAAIERIKTVLSRTGKLDRFGPPADAREMLARETVLGRVLPPSYEAAMRVARAFGEPETVLDAATMKTTTAKLDREGADTERYIPFGVVARGTGPERILCFDKHIRESNGELGVIEWTDGSPRFAAAHFAEWLDLVADSREEELERSATIPMGLRKLLVQLGFSFDDPVIGRLETGDVAAIEMLIGRDTAREIRGQVDRLFDSSGKASLTLNLDEFTLALSLRTGIFVYEAEDVFRWLRHFRDENFFSEAAKPAQHPDHARDLRKAPREAPLIQRGVTEMRVLPARRHVFRAASGRSIDDFYVLGRSHSTSGRGSSLLVHVLRGEVREATAVNESLQDLYVTNDGVVWGLSHAGAAVRFAGGIANTFPLARATRGRPAWYGIGLGGDRVLAWGAGALLEFDGARFSPFVPDAGLLENELVTALWASKREVAMLVSGDHVGAVARYDGHGWVPIAEHQVIDTALVDFDVWRGVTLVLARDGRVFRIEGPQGSPRPVSWDRRQDAFLHEGVLRPLHMVRGYDGGLLLASDGGVLAVGSGEPIFYSAPGSAQEQARLSRVGSTPRQGGSLRGETKTESSALVAVCGPNAWVWKDGGFSVIDLREF